MILIFHTVSYQWGNMVHIETTDGISYIYILFQYAGFSLWFLCSLVFSGSSHKILCSWSSYILCSYQHSFTYIFGTENNPYDLQVQTPASCVYALQNPFKTIHLT
jgi:hypothetical protein